MSDSGPCDWSYRPLLIILILERKCAGCIARASLVRVTRDASMPPSPFALVTSLKRGLARIRPMGQVIWALLEQYAGRWVAVDKDGRVVDHAEDLRELSVRSA